MSERVLVFIPTTEARAPIVMGTMGWVGQSRSS